MNDDLKIGDLVVFVRDKKNYGTNQMFIGLIGKVEKIHNNMSDRQWYNYL